MGREGSALAESDGLGAIKIVQETIRTIAPRAVMPDDFSVSHWLRDIQPDPWMIAAVLCDSIATIQHARTPKYYEVILTGKRDAGWLPLSSDDLRQYVRCATQPKRIERVLASLCVTQEATS